MKFMLMAALASASLGAGQALGFEMDRFESGDGKISIYFIGHGTLMIHYNKLVIHVDPVGRYADYGKLHKADIILITHEHSDHLDAKAVSQIEKKGTALILNQGARDQMGKGQALKNGDTVTVKGIKIAAVPAYNTTEGREKYHPKGRDNGYVLDIGGRRIYIAGDTEDIPEMAQLKDIDIVFLPVNQPYTMTPQQASHAAKMIKPKVLYPYHYGETDVSVLPEMLKDLPGVEVRIRNLQ